MDVCESNIVGSVDIEYRLMRIIRCLNQDCFYTVDDVCESNIVGCVDIKYRLMRIMSLMNGD